MKVATGLLAAVVAIAFAGCGPAEVTATGRVTMPSLAYVSPGVYAVSDLDMPWFFADGWYWCYDAGEWYRAPYLGAPRIHVTVVPPALARLPRPWGYAHYHEPHFAHAPAPRVHRG